MPDSILDSTKDALGLDSDYTVFDAAIIMHINSVFSDLTQLGVGPVEGFEIADKDATWASYTENVKTLNSVKSLMYTRVRLIFDPPATSFAITALEKEAEKFEWRLTITMDPPLIIDPIPEEDEDD